MADYINLSCPVCGEAFHENDDVVVCPVCGTPHHRECYAKNGACANAHWHAENKSYNADEEREKIEDQKRRAENEAGEEERRNAPGTICPRCGMENSPEALFCNRCGAPVSQGFKNPNIPENNSAPYQRIVVNPFVVPQDPNEEIDGIPAWKLSAVVGKNPERVIPQFKIFAKTGRKTSFNFFAFLLTPFYFLYRKMYALGIVTLILELVLSIPDLILNLTTESLSELLGAAVPFGIELSAVQTSLFTNLYIFSVFVSWIISIACGLFANWLYFKKCKKVCAEIDGTAKTEEEFKALAGKKGGVNLKLIITLAIVFGVLCFALTYIVMLFMLSPEMFGV